MGPCNRFRKCQCSVGNQADPIQKGEPVNADTRRSDQDALEQYQERLLEKNVAQISTEENRRTARDFINKSTSTCKIGTLVNYSYALRFLDNDSFGLPYDRHDKNTIGAHLAGLHRRMAPNSVKGLARCLVTFYNWLLEDVATPRSFWKAFTVKGTEPERMLVTDQEFRALLEAADYGPAYALRTLRDQTILHLIRETGYRRAELVSLNHGSVEPDPEGGTWLRMPASGKRLKTGSRDVLITESAAPLKALMMAMPGTANEPIFRSMSDRTNGRRLWPNEVGRIVTRIRRKAGITKRITPHVFRHTEATRLARRGWNNEMINKKLWTPGSKMGRIYIHLDRKSVV